MGTTGTHEPVATTGVGIATYTDSGIVGSVTNCYRVKAFKRLRRIRLFQQSLRVLGLQDGEASLEPRGPAPDLGHGASQEEDQAAPMP